MKWALYLPSSSFMWCFSHVSSNSFFEDANLSRNETPFASFFPNLPASHPKINRPHSASSLAPGTLLDAVRALFSFCPRLEALDSLHLFLFSRGMTGKSHFPRIPSVPCSWETTQSNPPNTPLSLPSSVLSKRVKSFLELFLVNDSTSLKLPHYPYVERPLTHLVSILEWGGVLWSRKISIGFRIRS